MFNRMVARSNRGFWSLACVVGCLLASVAAEAQAESGFLDRVYRDATGDHRYVVFVPENYTADKQWPVIMYLHGAGERGTDGRVQTTIGIGPYVSAREENFPFIVVFPQAENLEERLLEGWRADGADAKRALNILDEVLQDFSVDRRRQILTGWSMGGYGTWSIAAATPDRWSAIVPVSGGGNPATASALKDLPIAAYAGADDRAVLPAESRKMVDAVTAAGGHPTFHEIPRMGHDVWKVVYDSDSLYTWMRNPPAVAKTQVALRVAPDSPRRRLTAGTQDVPFVPALEIPQAMYFRLGNDALKAWSYSIPRTVPPNMLSGFLGDIFDSTSAEGRTFSVRFSGISYNGQLSRVALKAYAPGRLNIQLGVENVVLNIGSTYVSGSGRSATAGPINVVLGHLRPIWLSMDVQPYVQDRKLRLQLLGSRFSIPNDNWYVTTPNVYETHGLGMTSQRVSSGLVSGLYGSKGRIEEQVYKVIPSLLAQMEAQFTFPEATSLVESIWPLPVYRPQIRVWPMDASTDSEGITLIMGLTAASVDPRNPQPLRRTNPLPISTQTVPRDEDLLVGIGPQILSPLSQMLINANVARIHVLDIPVHQFGVFVDAKTMSEYVPDLKRYGDDVQIWSEVVLAEPVSVGKPKPKVATEVTRNESVIDASNSVREGADSNVSLQESTGDSQALINFDVPRMLISMAIKPKKSDTEWTPYAEFAFHISQDASAAVRSPDYVTRLIQMEWAGEPDIDATGRFAPGYEPTDQNIDVPGIRGLLTDAWKAWTEEGPLSQAAVPDVDFGYTKLRLSGLGWAQESLAADFGPAGVKITNDADVPFSYETKGPYSNWGGPYTLKPGDSHRYPISYPLIYRRQVDGRMEVYTLPPGSHSEFRVPVAGGAPRLFRARRASEASTPPPRPSAEAAGSRVLRN